MAYTDYAGAGGKPVELYHFALGSTEWFWTSAREPVTATIAGVNGGAATTYTPVALTRGHYASDTEAKTQNIEITTERHNAIALLFATGAPPTPVSLTIYGWQRDDVTLPTHPALFTGQVKTAKIGDDSATLQCGPFQDLVQQRLLAVLYQPTCNNALYGTRCQADRPSHTHAATVKAVDTTHTVILLDDTTAAIFAGDVATYGHGRLQGGEIELGNITELIISQDCTAGTITLMQRLDDVKPGDAINVVEGCDKLAATCLAQYANFDHFQGFPFVPTRNPFTGSVV